MKIILAAASILNPFAPEISLEEFGRRATKHIEWSGRISHRSEDAVPNTERFLQTVVMDHGDWSITEHVSLSVDAIMDRGITHEWVRHRMASYTQESTRFVNYKKKMPPAFVYPKLETRCEHCLSGNEVVRTLNGYVHYTGERADENGAIPTKLCAYDSDWLNAIDVAETRYKLLLGKGWRPQEARSVFPTALAARIVTTANLRSWRHFFLSRTSAEAHPQVRELATSLLQDFQRIIPVLYADIVPGTKQSVNFGKGR